MTEAQLRHQVTLFLAWLVMSVVAGVVVWAIALALGYFVHPLPVFLCAGVATWVVDGIVYRWKQS